MKNFKLFYYCSVVLLLAIVSCSEKDNLDPETAITLSVPTLVAPVENSTIVLSDATPTESLVFSWNAAEASVASDVLYSVNLSISGTSLLSIDADNAGKALTATISQAQLDEELSLAGYAVSATVDVDWTVLAKNSGLETSAMGAIKVTRFATEAMPTQLFITGDATEAGSNPVNAIALKRLNDNTGAPSSKFEVYTQLSASSSFMFYSDKVVKAHKYGGADGVLTKSGAGITVAEDGVYRISLDLEAGVYSVLKIDKWSVVGAPISGGWAGDAALTYKGNGMWQASIDFVDVGGFVFRANDDWAYVLKQVTGSTNTVVLEADATMQGVTFNDIPSDKKGTFIVTLDLSAGAYTYSIAPDPNAVGPLTTPETLFLLADGVKIQEFTKDGDTFTSPVYLALQASVNYTLNSAADGSGTNYILGSSVGATDTPESDKVTASVALSEGTGSIVVDRDQAYMLSFNFETSKLNWTFYNIKLFHWSDWDGRNEYLMTYEHPFKFSTTSELKAGYNLKFNSPWDVQFGADDAAALSGTMTNNGGSDFNNITTDGNYNVNIEITADYQQGTYEFIVQ